MAKGVASGAVNTGRAGAQWAGKKMDAHKTKKNAPAGVNSALQGATRQSKNGFHDVNSPSYHNVNDLDYKDQYKGAPPAGTTEGTAPEHENAMFSSVRSATNKGEESVSGKSGNRKSPPGKPAKGAPNKNAAGTAQRQQQNYRSAFPPSPPSPGSGSVPYMAPPDLNQIDQIIENSRPASPQASTHLPPPGIKPMQPKSKPPERGDRK